MTSTIEAAIQSALAAIGTRGKPNNMYFVACGGSFSQMHAAKYALERESKSIAADTYSSAEFIARNSPRLGKSSVVVLCSKSGDTPETVAAARFAKERGAYTIGLTAKGDSPLAQAVDTRLDYDATPDASSADIPSAIVLRVAFGVLAKFEANAKYDAVIAGLAKLPAILATAQAQHREATLAWAQERKRETVMYTMASGSNYGVAYLWACCILQEMQWIHSQAIHSGEYFHGPFEITDFDVPFVLLKGLGDCRNMDQRALDFAGKYSNKVLEIDANGFDFEGVDEGVREYLTPFVFLPLLRAYAVALSEARGHPLTVRRYMWKMEY
ncbi:SIS domain-containing protein [Neorhizobium galegae]|uniref:SIS domain-containing protein n=1 Tax=Neorhizobium galegae TaxID=399 RepID=UPI0006211D8A|nr:SIS domain-containing protein [Neorhizobium galegae]CDZ55170.1 Sugar isomerase [Neorhizobium galegae bv. orientalis]